MEISLSSIPLLNLHVLWFAFIVPCQSQSECPYGRYWDSNEKTCRPCSRCPLNVILKESQVAASMYECEKYLSLCPNWCSVEVSYLSGANDRRAREACPPTTPSPPVPFVNVTIDGPKYNETASSYTASCAMYFSNMDTPRLEWYNPSGQPLASTDTLGKWKVTLEVVTQGAMSVVTLVINDFQKGDEGNYLCSAHGQQIANQTILLEYVEPPPTTSPPTTPQGQSTSEPPNTIKPDTSTMQNGGGLNIEVVISIVVALLVVIGLCAFLAYWCLRRRSTSIPRSRVADFESHPLTGLNLVDGLVLLTSHFVSAKVVGIQACLDQPNCKAVIIKQNKRKIGQVRRSQDEFFIARVAWDDSIEVCMKFQWGKVKCIKILKMNCLKIGNVTETSAVITCPSVENTFYLHYEEKNAINGGSSQVGQVEVMQGGSKEICNLRPSVAYWVQLGIKGQTGDTGAYNWVWKDEFSTKCISFQPVKASETSVKLALTGQSVPRSLQLYCAINGSKPKQMTSTEMQFSSLVPGMDQVLHVQEKIGGTDRLLQEIPFKTTGSVQNGGNYREYATTDGPYSDLDQDDSSSKVQKKFLKKKTLTCTTGLFEAIHNLRDDPTRYKNVYVHAEQSIVKAVLESLLDLLKDVKDFVPDVPPEVSRSRKMKGMNLIEDFMIKLYKYLVNDTGIFDILRRFIEKEEFHTQAGVSFAEQLLDAHSSENGTCQVCRHAVYLLKWYEKRDRLQPAIC